MKNMMKRGLIMSLSIMALLILSVTAVAIPTVEYVKINGDIHEDGDTLVVERGDDLDVRVKLQAGADNHTNVEVEADIIGYEYNDREEISDSTHVFDMNAGDTQFEDLAISIPVRADKDYYDLRVRVSSRVGSSTEYLFRVNLEGQRHQLEIRDVILHPHVVEAGSSFIANVRLRNRGDTDEDDIKVTATIPELNLQDSDYVGELDDGESRTSEELFMRIPSCTRPGTYEVEIEVEYDEGFEQVTTTETIEVVEGLCGATSDSDNEGKSIIAVGSQMQQVVAGKGGATYSLTITNTGSQDKTYTLSVAGVESWGTYRVDPSTTTIVRAGETKPIFVFVSANEDTSAGQQSFIVNVASGDSAQPVQFTTNVVDNGSNVRAWAEYVLIGLVILLIILGLIIGFGRMRGRDDREDDDEVSGQTYY